MKWNAGSTTGFAAIASLAAGSGRIVFSRDYVLGGALILLASVLGLILYFRKPNA